MGSCKKEIDGYKQREFALEKFNKDDNSAIRFYTSFPNYKALPAFHNCFELKVAKLQYWDPKMYLTPNHIRRKGKKPGRKWQLSSLTELFIILVRPMVGLFIRDLVDRLEFI